ncbi:DEAD/DEAH box helicase family protein [Candidatus Laterigemmans baculatus]|uniref:DEAD/DEAH box helicase family protein n=1 Tax=Candidatus Laterigemmans baculatus TaxID=2770505 RepID=UPI0013DB6418|nr:DEAD/DEAH box helicase family protein [Candidatus Laterigemmans baculatus]
MPAFPAPPCPEDAPVCLSFHEGTLRLRGLRPRAVQRIFGEAGEPQVAGKAEQADDGPEWVFDDRDDCFRTDAVHYRQVVARLHAGLASGFRDEVPQWTAIDLTLRRESPQALQLRPDQLQATEAWVAGGRQGVIVMPTGTGKTVVAIELMIRAGTSTLVVAPIRDLMYQWHQRLLSATGIDAGIIGDGVHRVSPISVTTYDSAAIHGPRLGNRFGLIIFDEVHHLHGAWRTDAARMSAAPLRLGLTATPPADPERLQELRESVGPTVYSQAITAARGQTLADYRIKRIAVHLEAEMRDRYRSLAAHVQRFVADRRELDPKFRWEQIFKLTATDPEARRCLRAYRLKRRIEERASEKLRVLEDLFRLHAGEPVLVFVGSNAMARDVSMRFLIPCLLSHCGKRERADLLSGLAKGRYPALVANRVLDEGVDLPAVNVAIVIGGSASSRQATQRLGRVLRKGRGDEAILYEVVTADTAEVQRSRTRRRTAAFKKSDTAKRC